jgi:hypothetical protein
MLAAKWLRIYCSVVRQPLSVYLSAKSQPPYSFFGYVTFEKDGYILPVKVPIEFERQIVFHADLDTGFLHQSISCSLEAILTTFVNLGFALNIGAIQRNNPIKDWETPTIEFDTVLVRLLTEDSICSLNISWEEQDNCSVPESTPPRRRRIPPPPPPPPTVPPGSPPGDNPDISPPYEGSDDGGRTYNPDGGNEPPPPTCTRGTLRVVYTYNGLPNQTANYANTIYPVDDVGTSNNGTNFYVVWSRYNSEGIPCDPEDDSTVRIDQFIVAGIYDRAEVISWEFIPD